MKKLVVYMGDSPVYVEGFPAGCERSCEGSIHLLPRKHVTITDGEHAHILAKYKHVVPKLKVMAEMKDEGKKVEAAAPEGASAKPEQPTPSVDAGKADSEIGDEPKKKSKK